ncbi:hypothetical protein FOA52_012901 [Chlamydomonas sp. UWO 241]|nr:hypothetical protein FOA52_012901 [Chlamydomonas sp. UWO 241]
MGRMHAVNDSTAAYHAVLFSPDLAPKLLSSLDRASKVALRCVNKAMRSQVDASIVVVASPASGFSPVALSAALVRWGGMHDLTLLAASGTDLAPLATATLAGLTNVTVRQANAGAALRSLTFSSSVAATLQTIDVSGCELRSIDFVRSCVELRCLWMPGCDSVSDLSPLAACSETLEELWMAADNSVVSLAPLKACTRIRKLDLRGCASETHEQVEELQLACTQLADPASVQLESLLHDLKANMPAEMLQSALWKVGEKILQGGRAAQTAIAAAGAGPVLVELLGPGSSSGVQMDAAWAVHSLAEGHAANQAAIAAGAIPALVQLLVGPATPANVRTAAAGALGGLAKGNAENQAAVTAAGAIPALVQLLGTVSSPFAQMQAAGALGIIADDHAQNQSDIAAAGAVPALVELLGPGCSADMQAHSAGALRSLAADHAQNQAAITAAGAIPALTRLWGPGSSTFVQWAAARALRNLLDSDSGGDCSE